MNINNYESNNAWRGVRYQKLMDNAEAVPHLTVDNGHFKGCHPTHTMVTYNKNKY